MGKKGRRKDKSSATNGSLSQHEWKEEAAICRNIIEITTAELPLTPVKQWEEHLKLRSFVEKLRAKQAGRTISGGNDVREGKFPAFVQWFKDNGGDSSAVKIYKFEREGYGLMATRDIKAQELVVSVPSKLMMTLQTAEASILGPIIAEDRILRVMPNVALALHVLCEKHDEESFWAPYLDILPPSYSTPLYFTPEELQLLQGSPAFGEALKQYRNIARQYAYFHKLFRMKLVAIYKLRIRPTKEKNHPNASKLPLRDSFTFDDYRWAVCTVMTRQNQVPLSDTRVIIALIPMWDMSNHCNGKITTGYDEGDHCCKSLAMSDFRAGEQVYIFYGQRSNTDLLVHNGFVYPDNANDKVNIHLGISRSDPLYNMKANVLLAVGLTPSGQSYAVLGGEKPVSLELMAFLRVFSMLEEELQLLLSEDRKESLARLATPDGIVNHENETKAWSFMETRLTLIMRQYKSTLEEDVEFLKQEGQPVFTRMCAELRVIERKILQRAINFAVRAKAKLVLSSAETSEDDNEE